MLVVGVDKNSARVQVAAVAAVVVCVCSPAAAMAGTVADVARAVPAAGLSTAMLAPCNDLTPVDFVVCMLRLWKCK